jgi:hypothetical protein
MEKPRGGHLTKITPYKEPASPGSRRCRGHYGVLGVRGLRPDRCERRRAWESRLPISQPGLRVASAGAIGVEVTIDLWRRASQGTAIVVASL